MLKTLLVDLVSAATPIPSNRNEFSLDYEPERHIKVQPRIYDFFNHDGLRDVPIGLLALTWRRKAEAKKADPIFQLLGQGIDKEESERVRPIFNGNAPCKEVMAHMPLKFFEELGCERDAFVEKMIRKQYDAGPGVVVTWKQLLKTAEAGRINSLSVSDPCIQYLAWACFTLNDIPLLQAAADFNWDKNFVLSRIVGQMNEVADNTPNYAADLREMHHVAEINSRGSTPLEDMTLRYMQDPAYPKHFFLLYRPKIERMLYGIGSGQIFLIEGLSGVGKKTMISRMAELLANPELMDDLKIRHLPRFNNHRILKVSKEVFMADAAYVNQILYAHKAVGSSLFIDLDELKSFLQNGDVVARLLQVLKFGSTVFIVSSSGDVDLKKVIKIPMVEIAVQSPEVKELEALCVQKTQEMAAPNCVVFDDNFCKRAAELADSYKTGPNPAFLIKLLYLTLESRTIPANIQLSYLYDVCEAEKLRRQLNNIDLAMTILNARQADEPLKNEERLLKKLDFYHRMMLTRDPLATAGELLKAKSEWEHRQEVLKLTKGVRIDPTIAKYKQVVEGMHIKAEAVATPLSLLTEFSVDVFSTSTKDVLDGLFERMDAQVKNQERALKTIIDHLTMTLADNNHSKKHSGSIFMYGPTGVGKTQTVKVLAECLGKHLASFAMNEYASETAASTLLGADQGYIGHGTWGTLGAALEGYPSSIVFFDEFDKAHKNIRTSMLGILEEGEIWSKDSSVKEPLRLKHTIIFFASNFFGPEIAEVAYREPSKRAAGYQDIEAKIRSELGRTFGFKAEFLNRIQRLAMYLPITSQTIRPVFPIVLKDSLKRRPNWNVSIHKSVLNYMTAYFFNSQDGVRGLKGNCEQVLASKLATVQDQLEKKFPFDPDTPNEQYTIELYICHSEVEEDDNYHNARMQYCFNLQEAGSDRGSVLPNFSTMEMLYSTYVRYVFKGDVYAHLDHANISNIRHLGEFEEIGYNVKGKCKLFPRKRPFEDEIMKGFDEWGRIQDEAVDDMQDWRQLEHWEDNIFIADNGEVAFESTGALVKEPEPVSTTSTKPPKDKSKSKSKDSDKSKKSKTPTDSKT